MLLGTVLGSDLESTTAVWIPEEFYFLFVSLVFLFLSDFFRLFRFHFYFCSLRFLLFQSFVIYIDLMILSCQWTLFLVCLSPLIFFSFIIPFFTLVLLSSFPKLSANPFSYSLSCTVFLSIYPLFYPTQLLNSPAPHTQGKFTKLKENSLHTSSWLILNFAT